MKFLDYQLKIMKYLKNLCNNFLIQKIMNQIFLIIVIDQSLLFRLVKNF